MSPTILLPVTWIFLYPDSLTLVFVRSVVRICLLFFPLPFALSCLLATFIATVTLIFNPWVPATNPPAAGTLKGDVLHNVLPGLLNSLPER